MKDYFFNPETFVEEKIIFDKFFFNKDIKKNYSKIKLHVENKSVLIIGGAGTIGSAYTEEILKFKPSKVYIVDKNENSLTELTRFLRSSDKINKQTLFMTYPFDFNSNVFKKMFVYNKGFDIIANFAAHKHVRSEKDSFSIEAMIQNNIIGTIKLIELMKKFKPQNFFSVSTDKASKPVNVMGASKKIMENIILSNKKNFRVSTARFANVAFSNGSLLDGFTLRLKNSQPLSCPSDIKRFFVSKRQSGEICLLSTFLGESGDIFFPKFDFFKDQIFFKDITLKLIDYLGLKAKIFTDEKKAIKYDLETPYYPVFFFESNTSGEKKYEEFYSNNDIVSLKDYYSLGVIKNTQINISSKLLMDDFRKLFLKPDIEKQSIIDLIKKYVEDFEHIETGNSLDQKM